MSTEEDEDIAEERHRDAFIQDWQNDLGRQLRRRREEIGLTQSEVGELARVHRATIRAVESGKSVEAKTLGNVLRALACSPDVDPFDQEQSAVRPVLSATTTRWIIDGMFNLDDQIRRYAEDVEGGGENLADRDFMIDSYLALVERLADPLGAPPSSLGEFRANLAMTKPQLRMLDDELYHNFGRLYPYRNTQATSYGGSAAYATKVAAGDAANEVGGAAPVDVVPRPEPARGEAHFEIGLGFRPRGEVDLTAPAPTTGTGAVGPSRPEIRAILASGLPEHMQTTLIEYAMARHHQLTLQFGEEVAQMISTLQAAQEGDGS